MSRAPGVPQECWPCKSNSVCLGSSPRAQNRVGAFWAFNRVLAAGPVQQAYSSEPPRAEGGVELQPWPASWRRSASGSGSARSLSHRPGVETGTAKAHVV
jgi:hypothetical protein